MRAAAAFVGRATSGNCKTSLKRAARIRFKSACRIAASILDGLPRTRNFTASYLSSALLTIRFYPKGWSTDRRQASVRPVS
jgi:hypothetical protein